MPSRHYSLDPRLAGLWLIGAALLAGTLAGCGPAANKTPGPASATNAAPIPPKAGGPTTPVPVLRVAAKTNVPSAAGVRGAKPTGPPLTGRPGVRTNAIAAAARPGVKTNTPAAALPAGAKAVSRLAELVRHLQASPYFYPVLIGVVLCLAAGAVGLFQFFKSKSRKAAAAPPTEAVPKTAPRPVTKKARKAPIHSCNVLQVGPQTRHLWQFGARGRGFVLNREQSSVAGEPLPARIIGKDWRNLWQRKLNIAWLPPEQVFVRVTQLPSSDFNETLAMVELQLEKLSPLPVTQIVWSIQVLPHTEPTLQTVIVMIVSRNVVEEFLGQLEGQGYLADRLELPRLDQLQATAITRDGAWIYPEPAGVSHAALVAWWCGGVLQDLGLITLPPADRPAGLKEQLLQMAWAGELEGWLTAPPAWHLVADGPTAAEWEPALREGLEQPLEVSAPLAPPALAALTATRVAQTETQANLLPAEFASRYQQQFVDRLWMRGLGAIIGLYLVGVLIYFAWLQYALHDTGKVEQQVASLGPTYTNALLLKARFQVLKDRQDLKYAALDCWKAVAELLPEGVTLEGFNFNDGKRLSLNGTAPTGHEKQLIDFDADIHKAKKDSQLLFDPNAGEHIIYQNRGGNAAWSCVLELKRGDVL
jgi:hypothetical protein